MSAAAEASAAASGGTAKTLLEVEALTKRFGGLVAVNRVSLRVGRGKIAGLIGINGAGKSTLMNCIGGTYRTDEGRVVFHGHDITRLTPHEIAKAGIGRTFQIPRIFHRMTLIDNLMVPMLGSTRSDAELIAQAEEGLARVNLHRLRGNMGEELSGGQQKLLDVALGRGVDDLLLGLDLRHAQLGEGVVDLRGQLLVDLAASGVVEHGDEVQQQPAVVAPQLDLCGREELLEATGDELVDGRGAHLAHGLTHLLLRRLLATGHAGRDASARGTATGRHAGEWVLSAVTHVIDLRLGGNDEADADRRPPGSLLLSGARPRPLPHPCSASAPRR